MKFETPTLVVGKGITDNLLIFLAEPTEEMSREELFSIFHPSCETLSLIPFANFASYHDKFFVINYYSSIIEDKGVEYFEDRYELSRNLH